MLANGATKHTDMAISSGGSRSRHSGCKREELCEA